MAIIFAGKPAEIGAQEDVKFESKLISMVKFFPCIYDTTHSDYNNMRQNSVAWAKLSNSLKKPIVECINKWYTLLQIFLCLNKQLKEEDKCSSITWHHYYSMLKMGPKTPLTYGQLVKEKPPFIYPEPITLQKEVLVRQLEVNRTELLCVYVSLEQKQKIWLQISLKLNSINARVNMPMIKWQKYWCDLKQSVIDSKRKSLLKLPVDSNWRNETNSFLQDEVKILNIFGVKPTDSLEDITLALSGSMEIDGDMEKAIKCCRCNNIIRGNLTQKYCDACQKVVKIFCDLCLRVNQAGLTELKVSEWSPLAKSMLPSHLASFTAISMCAPCLGDMKRQAGAKWVACRICENYNPPLANLFCNEYEVLRKAFSDATNITFTESDGLPHYICKVCKVQMQQFNNFYMKYTRVQTRLLDIQDEFFIGVTGIVIKKAKNNNMRAAVQKAASLKSGLNALSESGNIAHVLNGKSPVSAVGIQKFTIIPPASISPTVQITKRTKLSQPVAPNGGLTPHILNRDYVGPYGGPSSAPLGNAVPSDKTVISHKPSTLQIIKGLPPGTNLNRRVIPAASVKAQQLSPATIAKDGLVRAQNYRPLQPKPPVVKSANSPGTSQNVVNVRSFPSLPANTTISTKQKPLQVRAPASNSPTVSGIITNQISNCNSPMLSSITIKTKSGTTTLSASSKYQANSPKVSTVSTSTATAPAVHKPAYTKPAVEQKLSVTPPTVFKIPDDMYDPNSPPAFCIPKSPGQAQNMAMSGFKPMPATIESNETPQNVSTPPSVVIAPEIKTEIVDEEYVPSNNGPMKLANSNCHPPENNIPMIQIHASVGEKRLPAHASTGFQSVFQSPLMSKSQFYGNSTILPEKPKANEPGLDFGVKRPQQQNILLPGPLSANKRPRKYWGAVDEFHIPSKIANHSQSMNQTCPEIAIKEERVDLEEDPLNKDSANSETFANTFYSDSFELGNVSLDAHVTDVLKHMIAHHQATINSENYQFNSSSFMSQYNEKSSSTSDPGAQSACNLKDAASIKNRNSTASNTSTLTLEYDLDVGVETNANGDSRENGDAKADDVSTDQSECKSNSESKAHLIGKTLNLRELRLRIDKARIIPRENKINSNLPKSKKFHLKNLRVKLKRNRKLQRLVLGAALSNVAARSCTMARRKSMRHSKSALRGH